MIENVIIYVSLPSITDFNSYEAKIMEGILQMF
jgi:hypothetical protein